MGSGFHGRLPLEPTKGPRAHDSTTDSAAKDSPLSPGFFSLQVDESFTLDEIAAIRGYPMRLRVDNGPENVAGAMLQWSVDHNVLFE